ncbi:MAG: translation initiation factor IF-2 [Oscillospiraceae bacterium]|nr:translation initiation factor IF-2 [Oscillospiraceae bacterium]
MNTKQKLGDVAKDLNVPTKELVDLLSSADNEKKRTTALSAEELNLVFETYTKKNSVDNFNSYFASGKAEEAPKVEEKKEEKNDEKKVEEAKEVKETPKQNKPQGEKPQTERKFDKPQGERKPQGDRPQGERKPYGDRPQGERKPYGDRPQGERKPQGDRPQGERKPYGDRPQGERKPYGDRPQGERKPYGDRPQGERKPYGDRPQGERKPYGDRPQGERKPYGDRPQNDRFQNQQKPQQPKPAKPAPSRPVIDPSKRTDDGTGVRVVDMRSTNVDLDKYNERYENIAPGNMMSVKGGDSNKQKFTGRNQKKNNFKSKKDKEAEKMRKLEMERERRQKLSITIPDEITVGDLALKLKIQAAEIVKRLMMLGVMASVSDVIDFDTAAMVAMEIGAKVEKEVVVTIEERLFEAEEDNEESLQERPPVVVVMGHVDHGKTSILDAIRHASVTSTEAGGITQHIGAYQVTHNDKLITFLDTPGHEAFTSMRARGANITDIAVLVVAADDGIMPQTIESINHAKAANVSLIVAINKMDKPTANPDRVKQQLTEHGIVPEEWGGDAICVEVSAKTKQGIPELLEMIQLVAEVRELKANPDRLAKGTVIEAKLDKGRGPVATILVETGTLKTGDAVIAGTAMGRVRVMLSDKGERLETAGPSTPVEITGLAEVPAAGDIFNAVEDERLARELVEQRKQEAKQKEFDSYKKVTLDNLFSQIEEGEVKELPVIVKADVQGSVEAVKQSLEKLTTNEVRVKVIHGAVGAVSKSDVMLAEASNAIIVGFNVRPDPTARDMAEQSGVDVKLYRVIYDAIEDLENAMKGMQAPKTREVELGRAEIRDVFKISGVGAVAGCYVLEGKITRNAEIRVVRDGIIIADDHLSSLKRFKDDVKEVAKGYECGMALEKFNDLRVGDVFEAYTIEEYRD